MKCDVCVFVFRASVGGPESSLAGRSSPSAVRRRPPLLPAAVRPLPRAPSSPTPVGHDRPHLRNAAAPVVRWVFWSSRVQYGHAALRWGAVVVVNLFFYSYVVQKPSQRFSNRNHSQYIQLNFPWNFPNLCCVIDTCRVAMTPCSVAKTSVRNTSAYYRLYTAHSPVSGKRPVKLANQLAEAEWSADQNRNANKKVGAYSELVVTGNYKIG